MLRCTGTFWSRPLSLVSVIIPAYNGQDYLADAIRSVLAQTYPHYEIIVIDNGSTDQTAQIAQSFPEVRYYHSAFADTSIARNLGLSLAQGDYIAFLDQDDTWTVDKLEKQVRFLSQNREFGAVIGHQQMYLEAGHTKPHWLKAEFLQKPQLAYLPSALLIRKETLAITNHFDTTFSLASDVAWFLKAKHTGVQIEILNDVVVQRRIHGDNTSNKYQALQKEILGALQASLKQRRLNA